MNFDLSEDQKMLVETVSSFVKKASPPARLRKLREDPIGWQKSVWKQMGEFGWLGVLFPEALGGFGGSFVDAALILEELGVGLAPEPYAPSLVAGTAILRAGSTAQHERWLMPMVAGETSLALAYAEAQARFSPFDVATRAERSGNTWKLSGEKRFVLNGHAADQLVVSARTRGDQRAADGISLFVVDAQTPGVELRSVKTMDGHHAALVRFNDVALDGDRLLGSEGEGGAALDEALDVGAAAACAEGAGIVRTVLWMTCDYLRTREQFGVKIGNFQALQHRAVDMFVETELSKSMSILASIKVSDGSPAEERRQAVSAAKVQLAVGGRYVTQQATQLHGGIGVTDEHDVGLYFKRMHILNTLYGDEEHHVARFAAQPAFAANLSER